jgi:hypothetical protein
VFLTTSIFLRLALAVAGVVYVAWEPLREFCIGGYSTGRVDTRRLHAPIVCGVALFVGLIPYRLRGWSLARRGSQAAASGVE